MFESTLGAESRHARETARSLAGFYAERGMADEAGAWEEKEKR
jgi:hypothetical protein